MKVWPAAALAPYLTAAVVGGGAATGLSCAPARPGRDNEKRTGNSEGFIRAPAQLRMCAAGIAHRRARDGGRFSRASPGELAEEGAGSFVLRRVEERIRSLDFDDAALIH